jgi:hypothetical protein
MENAKRKPGKTGKKNLSLPMTENQYWKIKKKSVELGYEEIEEFLMDVVLKGFGKHKKSK